MIPIKPQFYYDKFNFKLLKREGNVALFQKQQPKLQHIGYEVVIIQQHPDFMCRGKLIPAHEKLPPSSAWGRLGFTPDSHDDAIRRFWELVKTQEG
jgi:hypothetical protein